MRQKFTILFIFSLNFFIYFFVFTEVEGYIKNSIAETSLPSGKINQGAISDCQLYKLEIRMPSLCDMSKFKVGSLVKVKETLKNSDHSYVWIVRQDDVEFASSSVKTLAEVLKGQRIPKTLANRQDEWLV